MALDPKVVDILNKLGVIRERFVPYPAQIYTDLEEKLRGKTGSQVLVIQQEERIHGCPGIVPPTHIDLHQIGVDTTLQLGILTGETLEQDTKAGDVLFPTERHVERDDYSSREKWELREGPLRLGLYDLAHFGEDLRNKPFPIDLCGRRSPIPMHDLHFAHSSQIYVGDDVERYFVYGWQFADEKHVKSLHLFNEEDKLLDTSYVEALRLLGQQAPERFQKKYDQQQHQERVRIIDRLEFLVKQQTTLEKDIQAVYDSLPHGGFMSHGAWHIVDNEDDARVVSGKWRQGLQETKKSVQWELQKALTLDMHLKDFKIEQKPGVTVDVPVYIKHLCEKYDVPLPN